MTEQEQALISLAEHEEAIGGLYQDFADSFPEHAAFWSGCAHEEFRHAAIIRSMQDLAAKGTVRLTGRFNARAIQTSLAYIGQQTTLARSKQMQARQAFAIALSIESSLLENRYFEMFGAESPEFQEMQRTILEETVKHRRMVQAALEKVEDQPR
ncbi:MAG TPA: hypothetical protein PLB81_03925 [Deltaproteobacteria bacterium]|nr:hypothetical protein [Deltaproteobacteria bacterium]